MILGSSEARSRAKAWVGVTSPVENKESWTAATLKTSERGSVEALEGRG